MLRRPTANIRPTIFSSLRMIDRSYNPFSFRPTFSHTHPFFSLTAGLGQMNQTSGRRSYCHEASNEEVPISKPLFLSW